MALTISKLSFSYGKTEILKDINFNLKKGEILGIIGPNGAGKSTLIKLISRILKPKNGIVELEQKNINNYSRLELAKHIAVVPQATDLPDSFTAQEIVMMGRTPHLGFLTNESTKDYELVEKMMRRSNVWQFANRTIDALSGGEKQRVLLARALVQEPHYLLLDEPTNHLDLRYQVEVLHYVQAEVQKNLGALVILHDLNLAARVCHKLLVLHKGSVVAEGKPKDVVTEKLIKEVYGAEVSIFEQPTTGELVVMPSI